MERSDGNREAVELYNSLDRFGDLPAVHHCALFSQVEVNIHFLGTFPWPPVHP